MFMQIDAEARVVQTTRTPFKDYRSYLILLLILLLHLKLYKTSVHLKYTQNTNQNIIIAVSYEVMNIKFIQMSLVAVYGSSKSSLSRSVNMIF